MSKGTKTIVKTVVPKLRFPEFLKLDEWIHVGGDRLFEPITNKKHNSDLPILAITQERGAIPRDLINYTVIATDKSVQSYKVVDVGDFIISLRSFQGGIEYSQYKGICSPAYIILRKKEDIDSHFYRHYFKSDQFISDLNRNIEGIRDGKMVSFDQFSKIKIPFPSKMEQERIADCLSSLDDLITAQNDKINALKTYKKGLMQQLFPQEGETVPRLRFPEFEDGNEWESTTLGTLVAIHSGHSPSQYALLNCGEYPFVKVEDLNNCTKYQDEAREYSDETNGLIIPGSVIFPKRGAAIALNKLRIASRSILMDTNMMALTPNGAIETEFLYYYLSNVGLDTIADSSTIPQINNKHIIPFKLLVPQSNEQKRIAECLASLDTKIIAETQKFTAIQLHKKGLIQQLFPSLAGVADD